MSGEPTNIESKGEDGVMFYDPEKVKIYNKYLEATRGNMNHIDVFTSTTKQGIKIPIILKTKNIINTSSLYKTQLNALRTSHRSEWNCHVCEERNNKLTNYVDKNLEPIVCRPEDVARNPEQESIYRSTKEHIRNYIKETGVTDTGNWTYEVITSDTLFTAELYIGRDKQTDTSYIHYSYVPKEYISISSYEEEIPDTKRHGFSNYYVMYGKALNKYAPLLFAMFNKCEMTPDLCKSVKIILELLSKATYGIQQVSAVKWFIEIFDRMVKYNKYEWKELSPTNKIQLVIDTILNSGITEGETKDAFLGHYHTINESILNLLEKGTSERGVVKMIEERNRPSKLLYEKNCRTKTNA